MSILEVGCGPGLLCHRLAEWLPNSKITGLDRDENFIYMPRIKLVHLV
ncbi:class I SAM-dependent methyltransferase [Sporomusa ovata]